MINETKYTVLTCPCESCHTQYALPEKVVERLRETHETFFCPFGHTSTFPQKTEVELLRDRLVNRDRTIAEKNQIITDLQKPKRKPRKKTK